MNWILIWTNDMWKCWLSWLGWLHPKIRSAFDLGTGEASQLSGLQQARLHQFPDIAQIFTDSMSQIDLRKNHEQNIPQSGYKHEQNNKRRTTKVALQ